MINGEWNDIICIILIISINEEMTNLQLKIICYVWIT